MVLAIDNYENDDITKFVFENKEIDFGLQPANVIINGINEFYFVKRIYFEENFNDDGPAIILTNGLNPIAYIREDVKSIHIFN